MRIALLSTPCVSCPPQTYGGTELVVHQLAEGYVKRGHQVVLYATGDSCTSAELRYRYARAVWPPSALSELDHVSYAYHDIRQRKKPFDIIHSHSIPALLISKLLDDSPPIVHTIHHSRDEILSDVYQRHPTIDYIFISNRQRSLEVSLPHATVIHHGLQAERYPFQPAGQDYVAFIGRFAPYKGPLVAIEVARRAGLRLRIAGDVHDVDRAFYEQHLVPRLHTSDIEYLGPANHQQKVELLGHARATLFPISWEEPFGLVMIESMLCGTPVIAFARGSVPEIIDEGVTGYVVHDADEMLMRLDDAARLDRARIRQHAVKRFGIDRMVDEHLAYYHSLINHHRKGTQGELHALIPRIA